MEREAARSAVTRWYEEALGAVDPGVAVRRHLARVGRHVVVDGVPVPVPGRVVVAAVGKAAVPMARAAEDALGDLIASGIAITKDGHADGAPLARIRVCEASHPIPDERAVAATRRLLDLVAGLGPDDLVIALISGGGSALLEAPREGVTLADIAETTDLLLRAGAPIQDLNRVRIPLSQVKGGGLRRAAGDACVVTLILSDVLGNDTRIIASGPTVFGEPDGEVALHIIRQYGVMERVPGSILEALAKVERPSDEGLFASDRVVIVGDNERFVNALASTAGRESRTIKTIWSSASGEARERAIDWVAACTTAPAAVDVLLGGGELTVTVHGDGVGGRNMEFALAAAMELHRLGKYDWLIASLASDGQDGPTGAAGAMADAWSIDEMRTAGVDPVDALQRNDSLVPLQAVGGVVSPGPTGTNVCDCYIAVRLIR